jgi:hypothetical protein
VNASVDEKEIIFYVLKIGQTSQTLTIIIHCNMAQYIDKSALVAEVERRIKSTNNDVKIGAIESLTVSKTLNSLISFINTLEVKEVDLEKVIEEYFKGWTDDYDNGGAACHYQYVQVQDCKAIAKRFFELGLKAQKGE